MAAQKIIRTIYISFEISPRVAQCIKGIVNKNPRTTAVEIRNTLEVTKLFISEIIENSGWNLPKSIWPKGLFFGRM